VAFDVEGRTAIDWGVYGAPERFWSMARAGWCTNSHPMTLDIWEREFLRASPRRAGRRMRRPDAQRAVARGLALALGLARLAAMLAPPRPRRWTSTANSKTMPCRPASNASQGARCLVCQNESIADSNVELAGTCAGRCARCWSPARATMPFRLLHRRYGEFVRFSPPVEPKTLLIWGSIHHVAGGGVIIYRIARQRRACRWMTSPWDPEQSMNTFLVVAAFMAAMSRNRSCPAAVARQHSSRSASW